MDNGRNYIADIADDDRNYIISIADDASAPQGKIVDRDRGIMNMLTPKSYNVVSNTN